MIAGSDIKENPIITIMSDIKIVVIRMVVFIIAYIQFDLKMFRPIYVKYKNIQIY